MVGKGKKPSTCQRKEQPLLLKNHLLPSIIVVNSRLTLPIRVLPFLSKCFPCWSSFPRWGLDAGRMDLGPQGPGVAALG